MTSHNNIDSFRRKQAAGSTPYCWAPPTSGQLAENIRLVRAAAHRGETQYTLPAAAAAALDDAHRERAVMDLEGVRSFIGGLTAVFAKHLAACPVTDPDGQADIWARMFNSDATATPSVRRTP